MASIRVRVVLLFGSVVGVAACTVPLRQVPVALDPAHPDAPESALPRRVAPIELPPPDPDKNALPVGTPPPIEQMPAGHHMHHMHHMHPMPDATPKPPPAEKKVKPPALPADARGKQ
jgi:hypothetical protein